MPVSNYSEQVQLHTIIRGLADKQIRKDIMSQPNQDMTLQEALSFIEAKEAGTQAERELPGTEHLEGVIKSQYRQLRKDQANQQAPKLAYQAAR